MLFANWIRSTRRCGASPLPRSGQVLNLLLLEDRTVPSTFLVTNLDDSGAGSLRQAVHDANVHAGSDEIDFAHGLHGTIALTGGQLSITDALKIDGPGDDRVTISGNHSSRVFDVSNGATATIADVTIADGRVVDDVGGGIRNEAGSTLNLVGDTIADNTAYGLGGGVRNEIGAKLTVSGSTFVGNTALGSLTFSYPAEGFAPGDGTAEGGGIYTDGTATIQGSTFTDNLAQGATGGAVGGGKGGAIGADSTLTVTDCDFTDNLVRAADGVGGGNGSQAEGGAIDIANSTTVAVVSDSTFSNNSALGGNGGAGAAGADGGRGGIGVGGAISQADATLTLTDSIFIGNRAVGGTGGTGGSGGNGGTGGTGRGGAFVHTVTFGSSTPVSNLFGVTMWDNLAAGGTGGAGGVGGNGGSGGNGQGGAIRALLGRIDISAGAHQDPSLLVENHATGGAGGAAGASGAHGGTGGNGQGGAFLATFGVTANISGTTILFNEATGGNGTAGGAGGNGLGGGIYVDGPSPFGSPNVAVSESAIAFNEAEGGHGGAGGLAGSGDGGGVYVYEPGQFTFDSKTVIASNEASTSNDDIYVRTV